MWLLQNAYRVENIITVNIVNIAQGVEVNRRTLTYMRLVDEEGKDMETDVEFATKTKREVGITLDSLNEVKEVVNITDKIMPTKKPK